jgi:Amidohydrolase/D-Ala-D-Ala carboxypeptidase 3 (S13) family
MWSHLLTLACALLLLPAQALAGAKEKVAGLAPSGLVLVMDEKGNELVAQNADQPFVPASVTKIVTAWLAMEVLGGDYRFQTRFYLDGERKLYVRGSGDPYLISEELAQLASELVAAIGKEPLTGIVLDASYYPSDIRIPGIEDTDEAYDALNSALAVNFNTIHAVRKGQDGPLRREADPDHAAGDQPVPGAGPPGSRPHQPDPGPRGGPAICGRADRRIHRAGRRQRQGRDLDRNRARRPRAGLRSPPVAQPCGDPHRVAPRLEQLHRQPGLPGDRRASPGRAGQPREVAPGRGRDAREARPCRFHPSRGRVGHQPRQPLHGPRPRLKARIDAVTEQMRDLNWYLHFYSQPSVIAQLKDHLAQQPLPVVIDHFGGARAVQGLDQPGFDAVVDLVRTGRAYIKISGANRISQQDPDFPDAAPLAQALVKANPDRVLWGTDWPHLNPAYGRGKPLTEISPPLPIDDGMVLNQLPKWVPDPPTLKKILVDNPARVYGFEPIAG